MISLRNSLLLTAALTLTFSQARAQEVAASQPSSTSSTAKEMLDRLKRNARSYYVLEVVGAKTKALSGNTAGAGPAIDMNHYLAAGFRLGSKWSVLATQSVTQKIDNKPDSTTDPLVVNDPYITFSNSRILAAPKYGFGLSGYFRYYAPLSRASNQAISNAAARENGLGRVRITLNPNFSFFDGKLSLNLYNLSHYRFNSTSSQERAARNNGNPYREDFFHLFNPILSYGITSKVQLALDYSTITRRMTNNTWTNLDTEQAVSAGFYIAATKQLYLNPFIGWSGGKKMWNLDDTSVSLIAQYTFL